MESFKRLADAAKWPHKNYDVSHRSGWLRYSSAQANLPIGFCLVVGGRNFSSSPDTLRTRCSRRSPASGDLIVGWTLDGWTLLRNAAQIGDRLDNRLGLADLSVL